MTSIGTMLLNVLLSARPVVLFAEFFENLAFEAKIDADKPVMIKNSLHARKQMVRRAKTMRFEASRKRQSRGERWCFLCSVIYLLKGVQFSGFAAWQLLR